MTREESIELAKAQAFDLVRDRSTGRYARAAFLLAVAASVHAGLSPWVWATVLTAVALASWRDHVKVAALEIRLRESE